MLVGAIALRSRLAFVTQIDDNTRGRLRPAKTTRFGGFFVSGVWPATVDDDVGGELADD